jgi:diacylglycerol O-acyltransferase
VFNEPLTEQRELGLAQIELAEINAVTDALGVGAAEVFLAACTVSLRDWLLRHDAVPDQPLALQTAEGPVHLPVQLAGLIPPGVLHTGMRLYSGLGLSRRLPPMAHGVVAHIEGPSGPAYCAVAQVTGIYAIAPLVEGAGLTITSISRNPATLDLSVCACPDHVPDVAAIGDGIVEAVGHLKNDR